MPKLFFNVPREPRQHSRPSKVPQLFTMEEAEQVSGGRMKLPGQPPVTVYYDDGINILTSDPTKSNVQINIL